jgi:hypothetical protein
VDNGTFELVERTDRPHPDYTWCKIIPEFNWRVNLFPSVSTGLRLAVIAPKELLRWALVQDELEAYQALRKMVQEEREKRRSQDYG